MMTRIRISTHRDNRTIGIVTIADDLNERQIAEIANEAGGMSDLVALGESDLPAGYEWTGDEEYEVIDRRKLCRCGGHLDYPVTVQAGDPCRSDGVCLACGAHYPIEEMKEKGL